MAMMLRRENDLAVLRIRLVRTRDRSSAVVELEFQIGTGEVIPIVTCPTSELGLARGAHALSAVEGMRELPQYVADAIAAHLDVVGDRPSVWLELTTPCGYLALMPWEAWLTPIVQRAVIRLPYYTLRPRAALDTLDVVLCATSPMAKTGFDAGGVLLRLARQIAEAVPRRTTLHLFADSMFYPQVKAGADAIRGQTIVYDPQEAERYALPRRVPDLDDSYDITNPWLLWIRDALHGRGVDVLHFICHGYLSGDRGAMAFSSSPLVNTDSDYSRFVGLGQTCSLMTQIGAWSYAVSGPPHNYSQTALRELGDSFARNGPGFVREHDSNDDPEFADAGAAYGFLYRSGPPTPPPRTPSVTYWAHPRLVDEFPDSASGDDLLTEDGSSSVFAAETQQLIDSEETPAWLASTTRLVERVQAKWLDVGGRKEEAISSVSTSDAEVALRSVTELLARHVHTERGETQGTVPS